MTTDAAVDQAVAVDQTAAVEYLLSPDVGVVHRVDLGVAGYDHPRTVPAYAQVCDTGALLGARLEARAGAVDLEPRAARLAALGEAVERYCATWVAPSRLRRASVSELGPVPTAPPDWLRPDLATPTTTWVAGHRLRHDGPADTAWVAASRVFLQEMFDEGRTTLTTSTGLACHPDPWRALAAGLLEVVERDAVMTTWMNQPRVQRIATGGSWLGPAGNAVRFDRAIETYRCSLLDSPTGIPVVFAVAYGAQGQPGAAVGAAAGLDLARATRKALLEAHQTFAWASTMLHATPAEEHRPVETTTEPQDVDPLEQHVLHYVDPARLSAFEFLDDVTGEVAVDIEQVPAPPAPEPVVREIVQRCTAAGFDCFAVDVTAPDVRAAGLWAVRAVIPGMYPLIVGPAPEHPVVSPTTVARRDPHPFP